MNQFWMSAFSLRLMPGCLLSGLLFFGLPVHAAEPEPLPIDLHHTAWTAKDGAPYFSDRMAQTKDGWLWLGAPAGLYRFDGIRFEKFIPPNGDLHEQEIFTLKGGALGSLLIGYVYGRVGIVKDGKYSSFDEKDGLPVSRVTSVEQGLDGRLWASTQKGLFYYEGKRWQQVDTSMKIPTVTLGQTLMDSKGTLWIYGPHNVVYYLPDKERVFHQTEIKAWDFSEGKNGTIWGLTTKDKHLILISGSVDKEELALWENYPLKQDAPQFDKQGNLWESSAEGIFRTTYVGNRLVRQSMQHKEGLSGFSSEHVLSNAYGNVWVATDNGIDRFRPKRLNQIELSSNFVGPARAIAPGENGHVTVLNFDIPPPDENKLVDTTQLRNATSPPVTGSIPTLYRDPAGVLWTPRFDSTLLKTDQSGTTVIALPDEFKKVASVFAMTSDSEGGLWVAGQALGNYRLFDGKFSRMAKYPGIPDEAALCMHTGPDGRLWFGYRDNKIALLEGTKVRALGPELGLAIGNVLTITVKNKHVWAGGEHGLAHFDGQRFTAVNGIGNENFYGITGLIETHDGSLWVHSVTGISRISAAELDKALKTSSYNVRFERFDYQDGLEGGAAQRFPHPTAVEASDGKLWFSTTVGVYWIDPYQLQHDPTLPSLLIRGMQSEGKYYAPTNNLRLPQKTENLQIDYTALSFGVPERIQFRYRLEGYDREWQEAGTRRTAFYTNLEPGAYRFRVIASNGEGIWTETAASLDFSIAPTLAQSAWFRLLCALAAAFILWLLYQLRLRRLADQIHGRLEERMGERERIARELHDTLLQSVQGLILKFQSATSRIPENEPTRCMMEKNLQLADEVLAEGRDRVKGLRAASLPERDLAAELSRMGKMLMEDSTTEFFMLIQGKPVNLHPIVAEEAFAIAREALFNAFAHAKAGKVEVELDYNMPHFRMIIRDDGRGIDNDVIAAGSRPDHWGLAGMQERAKKINARLKLWSRTGAGTEWEFVLPAQLAYASGKRKEKRHWLKRRLNLPQQEDM
ncbi:sensor histidine kinase [Undibacterium terreum]|uniref:Histidine kinase n=1 Tax=Undibacterium terreum TaxID=1224302 RepID=A0A916XDX2_9BURK|nr:sensor histidine kinase [Undibacterium terreum]GGC66836.1 histidine kinase [Undibacterium terreum]